MDEKKIKDENLSIIEIEDRDGFDYDALPEAAKKKLDRVNASSIEYLEDLIAKNFRRCGCTPMANRSADLFDIDSHKFVAYVSTNLGRYSGLLMYLDQCSECQQVRMYGELDTIAGIFSNAFVTSTAGVTPDSTPIDYAKIKAEKSTSIKAASPEFILENTETGEVTDATDLMKQLSGN